MSSGRKEKSSKYFRLFGECTNLGRQTPLYSKYKSASDIAERPPGSAQRLRNLWKKNPTFLPDFCTRIYPLNFIMYKRFPLPHHRNLSSQKERECCKEFAHYITFNFLFKFHAIHFINSAVFCQTSYLQGEKCTHRTGYFDEYECKYDCDYFSADFYVTTFLHVNLT